MSLPKHIPHIILPLLAGLIIYILFRPESIFIFKAFEITQTMPFVKLLRAWVHPVRDHIPEWVIYSLPDGLYMYAFVSFIYAVWEKSNLWVYVVIAVGLCTEIGQWFGIIPGRFDPVDLWVKIAGAGIAYLVNNKNQYEKKS